MSKFMRVKSMLVLVLSAAMLLGVAAPAYAASKPSASIAVIKKVAKAHKLGAADTAALLKLAKRESNYNPYARNGSCLGLFQLKTKSKQWSHASVNTALAIKYIKHRYGTPRKALAHSYKYGWY
ncbi:MAG: hypothetical protein FDZ75_04245 [Actinobacteria bacterium]|nr:MAG: hypothetical protein FDZ75_04245 [Actinomycetota bacterium]